MNIVLWVLLIAVAVTAAYAGLSAAPWLPTKPKQRRHLIDQLDVKDGKTYYDLGCGDGSVLFALARKNPNVQAIGYEISLLPLGIGLLRKLLGRNAYKNVSLRFGNLFKQDVSDADVVFVFLLDKSYPKLVKKFTKGTSGRSMRYCRSVAPAKHSPRRTTKRRRSSARLHLSRSQLSAIIKTYVQHFDHRRH